MIPLIGGRELVEYSIQLEALDLMSVNQISRAAVKIVFRRKMEFHVTNTFLQTFILVCVGYMSLYFDVDNFTDRIMVTLTTMLLVATRGDTLSPRCVSTSSFSFQVLFSIQLPSVTHSHMHSVHCTPMLFHMSHTSFSLGLK